MAAELILDKVSVRLGGTTVIDCINAKIPGGTFCCLLGPNGAGKTTLLRALTGYLPLASGQIVLGSERLDQLRSRERARHVSLVPQLAPPVGPLTVFEAASLGRLPANHGLGPISSEDKVLVAETLDMLQLTSLADRRCDDLSGGEWRKVLVAQGIVQSADVMLLDEPTAFLDPPARGTILAAAKALCISHGTTVLAVLHDPQLAVEFADSALLLKHGQLMYHGPPAEATTEERLEALYANGNAVNLTGVKP